MDTPITDDYVISLLQKDSEPSRHGSLFPASKRDKNAPKPNTRFLRNLVRDADSHNAALLAKEKAETRARLRGLEHGGEKRLRDGATNDDEGGVKKRRRENEREGRWKGVLSGLGQSSTKERRGNQERQSERHHRGAGESSRSHDYKQEDRSASRREHRSHRRRSRSPDPRSRSRSPQKSSRRERRLSRSRERPHRHSDGHRRRRSHSRGRHNDTKRRSRSRSRSSGHRDRKSSPGPDPKQQQNNHDDSDSDPLDSLLGPAPPPTSRPRGRGANNTTSNRSTIDLRFNDPSYNPRTDVAQSDSEGEKDDWATSLEAMRDRAVWREKGAQRLREAGFGEGDVAKWEGSGREKDERDLKWRGKGEGREWDAGKVAGEEGEVRVKAAWTKGL